MTVTEEIQALFAGRGSAAYFGERVSMTEHAQQAAHFAESSAASPALVIAALLHDIGHLVEDVPDDLADWVTDARHEEVGSLWLRQRFPLEISEPVRLHVPAKRYLCAKDPSYFEALSPASVVTLELQGGPMSASEVAQFENERFFRDAVRLRHWDDLGKQAGLTTHTLADYVSLIEQLAVRAGGADRTL